MQGILSFCWRVLFFAVIWLHSYKLSSAQRKHPKGKLCCQTSVSYYNWGHRRIKMFVPEQDISEHSSTLWICGREDAIGNNAKQLS